MLHEFENAAFSGFQLIESVKAQINRKLMNQSGSARYHDRRLPSKGCNLPEAIISGIFFPL
jgi:hypothetical protein